MLPLLAIKSVATSAKGWMIGIIVAALFLGYWHYTSLLNQITDLRHQAVGMRLEKELLESKAQHQAQVIQEWQDHEVEVQDTINRLMENIQTAKAERDRLNELFAKHDMERLADRKPGLIERRVNRAVAERLRMLECLTGNQASCPRESTSVEAGPPSP